MTIEELATRPPRPTPTRVAPRPLRPVPPVRPMTASEYHTTVTRMAFQAACVVNRTRKASAAFAQPQVAEMHALLAHDMNVLCVELLNAAKWIARNEAELTMRSNEIAHLQAAAEAAAWDTDEEEEYYCYEEEEKEEEKEEEASIDLNGEQSNDTADDDSTREVSAMEQQGWRQTPKEETPCEFAAPIEVRDATPSEEDKCGLLMPCEAEKIAEFGCESEAAEQEDEQEGGKDDAKIDVDVDVDGQDFASCVSVSEEKTNALAPLMRAPESESETENDSESNSECRSEFEGATASCGEAGTAPVSAVVVLASCEDAGTATEIEAGTETTASASTRGSPATHEEPRVSRIVAPKILPLRGVRRPLGTLACAKTKSATGAPAMTARFGWKHPVVVEAVRAPAVVHVTRFDPVAEALPAVKKQERSTLVVDSAHLVAPPRTTKKKVVAAGAEATTTTTTTKKIRSKKPSKKAAAAAQPARWR